MRSAWRIAKTLLETQYAMMVEYRAEIILWCMSGVMPFILMGPWMKTAEKMGKDPAVFARYFFCIFLVRQLSVVWVLWEFEMEVVQGSLSMKLLQPLNPVWRHVASHFAERLARLPFLILLVILFFGLYPKALWRPSLTDLALFVAAISMSFTMRFVQQYAVAMCSFWIERASSIDAFVMLMDLGLSGLLAPLWLYPPIMKTIALLTPFPYLFYFPVSLLMGQHDVDISVPKGFIVLASWTMFFWVIQQILWRRGLRRYSSMGA